MRIGKVVGMVTLNRCHPSFQGARLPLAVPMSLEQISTQKESHDETLVVYDELGAGTGNLIMISEGAEAAQPFYPELKPVDAYNAGILDHVHLK